MKYFLSFIDKKGCDIDIIEYNAQSLAEAETYAKLQLSYDMQRTDHIEITSSDYSVINHAVYY